MVASREQTPAHAKPLLTDESKQKKPGTSESEKGWHGRNYCRLHTSSI